MRSWDHACRKLAEYHPASVAWVALEKVPLAVEVVPPEVVSIERTGDFLGVLSLAAVQPSAGSERFALHVEFESGRRARVPKRLRLVNAMLSTKLGMPIRTVVLRLRGRGRARRTRWHDEVLQGEETQRFSWVEVNVRSLDAESLLAGPVGTLPLVPLTEGGERPGVLARLVRRIETEAPHEDRASLLALAVTLGGLRGLARAIKRRVTRRDMLKESDFYLEALNEGKELGRKEGKELGRKEGKEEGKELGLREGETRAVRLGLEVRFGPLRPRDATRLKALCGRVATRRLLAAAFAAEDLAGFFGSFAPPTKRPRARPPEPRRARR